MADSETKEHDIALDKTLVKRAFMDASGFDITNQEDVNRVVARSLQKRMMAQASSRDIEELVPKGKRLETRRILKDKHIKDNKALIAKKE